MLYTLAIFSIVSLVSAYNYQQVSTCRGVTGDPSFNTGQVTGIVREIYATSKTEDAGSDRCVYIKQGIFYVTRMDLGRTLLKFKLGPTKNGAFDETGPDNKSYRVVVLKKYGTECGNMNLLFRCSDSVGDASIAPFVKLHASVNATISSSCMKDAEDYAQKVLGQPVKLNVLKNCKCFPVETFCSA
uniref:Uncharacterized protein n=1 Tax=Clastoptera arizonana TaxID=38151 RepID=A0A1B6C2E0_9HEMI